MMIYIEVNEKLRRSKFIKDVWNISTHNKLYNNLYSCIKVINLNYYINK